MSSPPCARAFARHFARRNRNEGPAYPSAARVKWLRFAEPACGERAGPRSGPTSAGGRLRPCSGPCRTHSPDVEVIARVGVEVDEPVAPPGRPARDVVALGELLE